MQLFCCLRGAPWQQRPEQAGGTRRGGEHWSNAAGLRGQQGWAEEEEVASWQAAVGGSGEGEEGHLRASSRAMASEELTGFLKADGGKLNELPLGSAGLEVTEICGYI